MPAFAGAHALGIRVFETDLHATADGVLMAVHDATLDRTTDTTGKIRERTLGELAAVDAGYRFGADEGFPFRGKGVAIPTLEEVASTFPDTALIVDMKSPDLEELLVALIERLGLAERIIVGSFSDARLRRFRRLAGHVATSAGPREVLGTRTRSWARRPSGGGAAVLQVPVKAGVRVVDAAFVAAAHAAGKHVHVWTVNDEAEMRRLLGLGVDGIITDRPDILQRVLGR